jgi:putative transposase
MGAPTGSWGRPRKAEELEQLVVRMARENRNWGYRRIQGALSNLGHEVARSTIAGILQRHGLEPAPERSRKTTWKEFLARRGTSSWRQTSSPSKPGPDVACSGS